MGEHRADYTSSDDDGRKIDSAGILGPKFCTKSRIVDVAGLNL